MIKSRFLEIVMSWPRAAKIGFVIQKFGMLLEWLRTNWPMNAFSSLFRSNVWLNHAIDPIFSFIVSEKKRLLTRQLS